MSPDTPTGVNPTRRATAGGQNPSRAIAAKKEQAAANRGKITAAITALQRGGRPINVQSVARAAGVHPHTLRRRPDLLQEARHLRENSHQRPPIDHADPTAAASYNALKARLPASQGEVAELRVQLMNGRDTTRSLETTITTSNEDLTAAREVARDYLRELDQTREELQRAHQKLTGLRIRAPPPRRTGKAMCARSIAR